MASHSFFFLSNQERELPKEAFLTAPWRTATEIQYSLKYQFQLSYTTKQARQEKTSGERKKKESCQEKEPGLMQEVGRKEGRANLKNGQEASQKGHITYSAFKNKQQAGKYKYPG